jgi:quinol-cytochrome oxidoreductase complex cytochrome b subunit
VKDLFQIVLVAATVVAILVLFVSPALDLEPSAMRAMRHAHIFFHAFAAAASMLLYLLTKHPEFFGWVSEAHPARQDGPDLFDLNCTRLC